MVTCFLYWLLVSIFFVLFFLSFKCIPKLMIRWISMGGSGKTTCIGYISPPISNIVINMPLFSINIWPLYICLEMEINIYLYNFDNFRMHNKCDYHIYLCIRLGFNLWEYMFFPTRLIHKSTEKLVTFSCCNMQKNITTTERQPYCLT